MSYKIVPEMYRKFIRGSEKGAIVQSVQVLLCNFTNAVTRGINSQGAKAYIHTRALKHNYDKRPAEEFDFLIDNLHYVVKFPDSVYRNKGAKTGDYLFVKKLKNKTYTCSLQEIIREDGGIHYEVVTFFRISKENYLTHYDLLWEWKGGKPSS